MVARSSELQSGAGRPHRLLVQFIQPLVVCSNCNAAAKRRCKMGQVQRFDEERSLSSAVYKVLSMRVRDQDSRDLPNYFNL